MPLEFQQPKSTNFLEKFKQLHTTSLETFKDPTKMQAYDDMISKITHKMYLTEKSRIKPYARKQKHIKQGTTLVSIIYFKNHKYPYSQYNRPKKYEINGFSFLAAAVDNQRLIKYWIPLLKPLVEKGLIIAEFQAIEIDDELQMKFASGIYTQGTLSREDYAAFLTRRGVEPINNHSFNDEKSNIYQLFKILNQPEIRSEIENSKFDLEELKTHVMGEIKDDALPLLNEALNNAPELNTWIESLRFFTRRMSHMHPSLDEYLSQLIV